MAETQILSALFNPHTFLNLHVKPWFHSVFVCGSVHSCNHTYICPYTTLPQPLMSSDDHQNLTDCTWLSVRNNLNMQWIISLFETHLKSSMNSSSGYFLPKSQMCAPYCQRSDRSINLYVNAAPFSGNVCTTSPCSLPSSIT